MTSPGGPGPKPGGPTHPQPTGPGRVHALPRKEDQIRTAIRLLIQATNALTRIPDPTSAPDDDFAVHDLLETQAAGHIAWALGFLCELASRFEDRPGPDAQVRGLPPGPAAGSPPARESTDAPQAVRAGANVTAPPT